MKRGVKNRGSQPAGRISFIWPAYAFLTLSSPVLWKKLHNIRKHALMMPLVCCSTSVERNEGCFKVFWLLMNICCESPQQKLNILLKDISMMFVNM